MNDVNPGLGHNQPPDPIELLLAELIERHAKLVRRAHELLESEDRVPPEIADDDQAGKVGDLVRLISQAMLAAETTRKAEKEPHVAAGRAVDKFFADISEPLAALKKRVSGQLSSYLAAKAERERRAREDEARRLREEAEKQAAAAAQVEAAAPDIAAIVMAQAIATEAQAADVQRSAEARPADLSRTRGDVGSVASLRTRWVGEIVDRATLDLETLRPYIPIAALQTALNGAIKAGVRSVRGASIREESSAVVR